jgi:alpha-galactosidase
MFGRSRLHAVIAGTAFAVALAVATAPLARAPGPPAVTAAASSSDSAVAATPPMGWNDWYSFGCNLSEKLPPVEAGGSRG